ncbi:hypothetical protein [Brucella pseudintermedia]|uniref:hypothetical protein n=1 Tax=Brucella pseudintermedia TaxID=370111 RepID=UPI00124EEF07|nr:hypothetical protein [Brucella pseudintermedia]KAB2681387.1 hypothetical protein F9K78_14555 [Brucella pseudintermedia]
MLDLLPAILDTLPATSRLKLERLASDRAAAYAAYRAASDLEQAARIEFGQVSGLAQRQAEAGQGLSFQGDGQKEDAAAAEARLDAPVEAAKRALQVAVDARERAAERQNAFGFLENVETWLRRTATPGASFREAKIDPALVKVRGDIATEIAKVRARIERIEADFAKVEGAPTPAVDLKARAFAEIDRIADAGALKVHPASRSAEPLGLARKLALGTGSGGSIVGTGGTDIFVWLLRDQMKAAIASQIDQFPASGALSDDEREAAFRQIAEQRLELERIEEHLIATAAVDGRHIARRADADPRAVLGIEA